MNRNAALWTICCLITALILPRPPAADTISVTGGPERTRNRLSCLRINLTVSYTYAGGIRLTPERQVSSQLIRKR